MRKLAPPIERNVEISTRKTKFLQHLHIFPVNGGLMVLNYAVKCFKFLCPVKVISHTEEMFYKGLNECGEK